MFPLPNVLFCQQYPVHLINVNLSSDDATLPDIAIKTNKKLYVNTFKLFQIFWN